MRQKSKVIEIGVISFLITVALAIGVLSAIMPHAFQSSTHKSGVKSAQITASGSYDSGDSEASGSDYYSAAEPASYNAPQACPSCGGYGQIWSPMYDGFGHMIQEYVPCPSCNGTGWLYS